jgi:hypothetical protein
VPLVQSVADIGCEVFGPRCAEDDGVSREPTQAEISWAGALFSRLERYRPDLIEPVFRALTKVLHPDVGGSLPLQRELIDARRRFSQKAGNHG